MRGTGRFLIDLLSSEYEKHRAEHYYEIKGQREVRDIPDVERGLVFCIELPAPIYLRPTGPSRDAQEGDFAYLARDL